MFGQLTWPLADSLRLTTGLRFTRDTKTYHYGVRSTGRPVNTRTVGACHV